MGRPDRIRDTGRPAGAVLRRHATDGEVDDPSLAQLLDFLACDIAAHPQQHQALDARCAQRIGALVRSEVDRGSPPR